MEILMWKVPVVGENSNSNNKGIYRLLERTPTTTSALVSNK